MSMLRETGLGKKSLTTMRCGDQLLSRAIPEGRPANASRRGSRRNIANRRNPVGLRAIPVQVNWKTDLFGRHQGVAISMAVPLRATPRPRRGLDLPDSVANGHRDSVDTNVGSGRDYPTYDDKKFWRLAHNV